MKGIWNPCLRWTTNWHIISNCPYDRNSRYTTYRQHVFRKQLDLLCTLVMFFLHLSLSKIIQTVTLKVTLTQCNLGSYKTAYIGVSKDKTFKIFRVLLGFKLWHSPEGFFKLYVTFNSQVNSKEIIWLRHLWISL